MTLKGNYAAGTSYSVGDVVKAAEGWHVLRKSASAGTPVTDTRYWQQTDPCNWELLDLIAGVLANVETVNPNPKELVLASSTASSTKKFKITVVDAGTISASEIS